MKKNLLAATHTPDIKAPATESFASSPNNPVVPMPPANLATEAASATASAPGLPPTVLITGSNRGIGLALARSYAERGW